MATRRKITARVPTDVLARARARTGKGITETVRLGREAITSTAAAQELRALRGKVQLNIDLTKLRRDR